MIIHYFMGPLVGGVIGYFTNWLAIKMLFRPHTAKYIGSMRIPFTPGIIPKEKQRIALAVGDTISQNLMNKEVLQRTLLSDEIISRMEGSIARYLQSLTESDETLRTYLGHYLSEEEITALTTSTKEDLGHQVQQHLAEAHVGDELAHIATQHVLEKMWLSEDKIVGEAEKKEHPSVGDIFKKGIDLLFNKQSRKVFSDIVGALAAPIEQLLAKNINEMMEQKAGEMTANLIGKQTDTLLDRTMADILKGKQQHLDQLRESLIRLYREMVEQKLPHMLQTLNISRMIETRINEMDMMEAEHIILEVIDKELKWLVWLGALLGGIIGIANTLTYNF